ncbi:hypothetical protein K438DRAFT_1952467 [Mycena galopus ATCC 62051]|nr:hypothetical protein K438DRAFT_1952467 [Mycena galopus ATCC 62051]
MPSGMLTTPTLSPMAESAPHLELGQVLAGAAQPCAVLPVLQPVVSTSRPPSTDNILHRARPRLHHARPAPTAILCSPPRCFPMEAQGVPCDVNDDEGWEECALAVAARRVSPPPRPAPRRQCGPSPLALGARTRISACPVHRLHASLGNYDRACVRVAVRRILRSITRPLTVAYFCNLHLQARAEGAPHTRAHPPQPLVLLHALLRALRSRAQVQAPPALARLASPKTFAFARRYFNMTSFIAVNYELQK